MKITGREELQDYMDSLELYGDGGTDFRPAFAYVEELMEKREFENLKGLVYFTDGYGIFRQRCRHTGQHLYLWSRSLRMWISRPGP